MVMSLFNKNQKGEDVAYGTSEGRPPETFDTGLSSAAAALAYAGALPVIIGVILAWVRLDWAPFLLRATALYGIALIAFFGGVRWGVAVMGNTGPTFRQLAGSILPLILAVVMMGIGGTYSHLAVLVVAIPLLLVDDLRATKRGSGAPNWYLAVRVPLSVMLEVSFIAGLLAQIRITLPS